MTSEFLKFINEFIFVWEGGYDTDPDDPGNYTSSGKLKGTKYGIDARSHPNEDIKNLTKQQAAQIYWDEYYIRYGCDKLPSPLCWIHLNACINCGPGRAKTFLAVNNTAEGYLDSHEAFYHRLVRQKPSFGKFLKGWLNRTNALRRYLKIA